MVHTVLSRGGAAFAVFRLPSTLLLCIVVLGKVAVVPVSATTGVLAQTVSNTVWRYAGAGAVPRQGLHARRVATTGVSAQIVRNTVWYSGAVPGQGLHARRVATTGVSVQTVQNTVWRYTGTVPGQGLHARRVATTGVLAQTLQNTVWRFFVVSRSRSWCTSTTDHGVL